MTSATDVRRRRLGYVFWILLGIGALFSAAGQIPSPAERILNSGLNPSNCTWRAMQIRPVWPPPKRATNQPPLIACFRYDFELSARPRQAAMTFFLRPGHDYQICVNGQLAADAGPVKGYPYWAMRNLDLTPHMRSGRNVITLKGAADQGSGFWLVAEGIAFGEDGRVTRLMTDQSWRGGWNLAAGWDQPETAATNLPWANAPQRTPYRWSAEGYFNPPYYGVIQVMPKGMVQPIFDEGQAVELDVTVINAQGKASQPFQATGPSAPQFDGRLGEASLPVLAYEIFDEHRRNNMGQGVVELKPEGKLDLAGQVKCGPLPHGAYRLRFVLAAGTNQVDRRDYELAVVGEIPQRVVEGRSIEDGLKLKKIWSVDCTAEPDPQEFVARYAYDKEQRAAPTKVVEGPAGRYRTLESAGPAYYFAYRFKVQRLYAPHLAVVEWPDDARRNFQILLVEGPSTFPAGYLYHSQTGAWVRGESGVISDEYHPLSNRMQKSHIIYWPNEEAEAIHIFNLGGVAAAAAKITVSEILNDLPAVKLCDAGDRLIGYQTERGPNTMSATYYAGPLGQWLSWGWGMIDHPGFYRDWMVTTENMIKRMRFEGQNLYLMGHFMYNSVLYPSKRYAFAQRNGYNGGDANRDYAGLILRMYEANGLKMISGIEYINTPDLLAASPATEEEVRQGAPTLFCVGKSGKFAAPHGFFYGGMNYFHPQVQEGLLAIVGELADLYGSYPAWKGVAFMLSRAFGPIGHAGWKDDPLDFGYEDYTIDLFQKETGLQIPVDPKAPDRFQQRYDWLMVNARQRWVDWRCDQFTKLYQALRDRMVRARPDLTLYLFEAEPLWAQARPGQESTWDCTDAATVKPTVNAFGFDVEALKREPGIVISHQFLSPGTRQSEGAKTRDYIDLLHNADWQAWWANDGKGGAYIWSGFTEYAMPGPGEWVFQRSGGALGAYPWLPGDYRNDAFVNVLVRSNPSLMPHTWIDMNDPGSRFQESRQFARAYRSLPNGKYARLVGNGRDLNLWVESVRHKGAEYAYAANAQWWPLEKVTLTLADGIKVYDLITGCPVKLRRGHWTFTLGPYAIQTFRIDGGAAPDETSAVLAAETTCAAEAAPAVAAAIAKADQVTRRARAKEADLRARPGWSKVEAVERVIAECRRLEQSGDLARAYELATAWKWDRMTNQVLCEVLEAMPFLGLGPFGEPTGTQGAGKISGGWVEVVADFRGMETPYLDEFVSTNYAALRADWAPDLKRTYSVYPDKSARWQEIWKTYFLSFFGKCHSEPPLWMVAYAYTEVYSPEARDASVWAGSDHALWVWANDRLILRHGGQGTPQGGQRVSGPDQNRGGFRLKAGWNRILVKAVQRGETRVFFRLTDSHGRPMDDLIFRAPKAG